MIYFHFYHLAKCCLMIYFNFYHLAKCIHNFINFHFYHCQIYILFIIFFYFYPFAKTGWFLVPSAATCGRQLPTNHPVAALALAVRVAKCICSNCQIYLWRFSNILVKIAQYICILVQISNCICPNQTTNHPVAAENFFLATFPGYSKLLTGCQWQRKKW